MSAYMYYESKLTSTTNRPIAGYKVTVSIDSRRGNPTPPSTVYAVSEGLRHPSIIFFIKVSMNIM